MHVFSFQVTCGGVHAICGPRNAKSQITVAFHRIAYDSLWKKRFSSRVAQEKTLLNASTRSLSELQTFPCYFTYFSAMRLDDEPGYI